eukprot:TRINITY_DN997_c0_g1_i1.p1 TRINITY_DN997_c0_g1~~TRINITY_DN997_c0_g1_i1.p1  ORF type:complete len:295 (+),score=86.53 TRINITY_DN997_c0_g1_i1:52-936(+)
MNNISVLIVGCGGIGSELIDLFSDEIVQRIGLVDYDKITEFNVNRQQGYLKDHIGQYKVDVQAKFLEDSFFDSFTEVIRYKSKIEDLDVSILADYHVIFMCVDSLNARRYLNQFVFDLHNGIFGKRVTTLLIDTGSSGFIGHSQIIVPGKTACVDCHIEAFESNTIPLCSLPSQINDYVDAMIVVFENFKSAGIDLEKTDNLLEFYARVKQLCVQNNVSEPTLNELLEKFSFTIPALQSINGIVACRALEQCKQVFIDQRIVPNFSQIQTLEFTNVSSFTLSKNEHCFTCGLSE